MNLSKETMRQEALRHRDRIDPASEPLENATALFLENLKPQTGQAVSVYWPLGREFDPGGITEALLGMGVTCLLPVIVPGSRLLKFAKWRDGDALVPGPMGIMQPAGAEFMEPDIVIVPMLAFDRRGYRLGYGGGYYDATLHDLRARKAVTAVGVAYGQQAVLFGLPTDSHDEKLDWVITPQKALCFC